LWSGIAFRRGVGMLVFNAGAPATPLPSGRVLPNAYFDGGIKH